MLIFLGIIEGISSCCTSVVRNRSDSVIKISEEA